MSELADIISSHTDEVFRTKNMFDTDRQTVNKIKDLIIELRNDSTYIGDSGEALISGHKFTEMVEKL